MLTHQAQSAVTVLFLPGSYYTRAVLQAWGMAFSILTLQALDIR